MSLQIERILYRVKSVKIVEGNVHEVVLIYSNPNLIASSEKHYKELCEKEAKSRGVKMEITVYHTAFRCVSFTVNSQVWVQFVYDDTPYIDGNNQPMNCHYSLIEYQELYPAN